MKNKNNFKFFIGLIIGVIISLVGSTYAATQIIASNVNFSPKDTNWNVRNAEAAINDLYYKMPGIPTGTVLSIMGTVAPKGYLICDGSEYEISSHSNLAEYIKEQFGSYNYFGGDGTTTFKVPDLRGEFLRGTGTNSHSNQGSGLKVGLHQDATKENYSPSYGTRAYKEYWASTVDGDSSTYKRGVYNEDFIRKPAASETIYYENWTTKNITSFAMGTNHEYVRTYYTSRPTNTSVLYIIKY